MRIVFLGPPGAGKGTQASTLSSIQRIPHISTGDMFRQAVNNQTATGLEAKRYMDSGALVPDEVTIHIVKDRLSMEDCAQGFILDGFPRTAEQAQALDSMLEDLGEQLDAVVCINIDSEALIKRLSGRRTCKGCGALFHVGYSPPREEGVCDQCGGALFQRDDDKEDTVRRRLEVYGEHTLPLIRFYRDKGLLADIDGNQDKELVTRSILSALG